MKRRKVTVAVLSVVLAAAALTGCGSAQQTNGPKKTRVVLNEVAHSILCTDVCGNRRRIF